jgi:hypothetical protein
MKALKVVILQPSYIPWRGFFHQIYKADLFIFCDDVQYDKRGWRNRNQIKTGQGKQWLTIPVYNKGAQVENIPIKNIRICWDRLWNEEHWKAIRFSYVKAPYFKTCAEFLEPFYRQKPEFLADFTIDLTIKLASQLGISHTRFMRSSELEGITGQKTDRLINTLTAVNATHYISGPSAQDYIDEDKFAAAGITLEYMNYDYPVYPQLYPPYDPYVSILDLLFMKGPEALDFIISKEEKNGSGICS